MSMSAIELTGVSKSYRGRRLFSGVDLTIERGRVYAVQGPNGSGKSVLFKILSRFVRPDSGEVHIAPDLCDRNGVLPVRFGVIIDRPGYISGLSGIDNLRTLARIRDEIGDAEIRAAMERVGLNPDTEQKVRHYSLGMKQKLALAQAFMENQQLLILDEPFNALDVDSVARIRTLLHELHEEGRTIVMTSHNQEDVDALAEHVFRINGERLEVVGTPS
jgi:ABC-2 type transport system ATP-binding protein